MSAALFAENGRVVRRSWKRSNGSDRKQHSKTQRSSQLKQYNGGSMQSNHTNRLRVDAQGQEQCRKERRIKDAVTLGRAIFRDSLRAILGHLKRDDPRHPYFELGSGTITDILRDRSHPLDGAFDIMARMKEDHATHYEVRVFAAKTFVGFADALFTDERAAIASVAPRVLKEAAEATTAQYEAAMRPCAANDQYALNETIELVTIAEIAQQALAANAAKRHLQLSGR